MEKLYTIHLLDWLGEKEPDITENESGQKITASYKIYSRFLQHYRHDSDFFSKFEIAYDVPNEPHPVPFFVSEYKLSWKVGRILCAPKLVVTPVLTEKGVLRRAYEKGETQNNMPKPHITPFGYIYY